MSIKNNTYTNDVDSQHPMYPYSKNKYLHPIHGLGYLRYAISLEEIWVEWTNPTFNVLGVFTIPYSIDKPENLSKYLVTDSISQCECGKNKHGFANHTYWCPLGDSK